MKVLQMKLSLTISISQSVLKKKSKISTPSQILETKVKDKIITINIETLLVNVWYQACIIIYWQEFNIYKPCTNRDDNKDNWKSYIYKETIRSPHISSKMKLGLTIVDTHHLLILFKRNNELSNILKILISSYKKVWIYHYFP